LAQDSANFETVLHYAKDREIDPVERAKATRTAFVARFIVLREGRRSRAHRIIEQMSWDEDTLVEELYERFKEAFSENGDKIDPVMRDLNRALAHAQRSVTYFINQYLQRSTLSFKDALEDYEYSNKVLFGSDEEAVPRSGGWRLPSEIS